MDRFQDVSDNSPCHCREGLMITKSLQEKMCGEISAVMFTIPYLTVLFMACFRKIFKLILHNQPTNLAPFSQAFLGKPFCRIRINSCVVCDLFPRQNKIFMQNLVNPAVVTFYFDLVLTFYFLKWDRSFSTLLPVLTSLIYVLITARSMYEFTV